MPLHPKNDEYMDIENPFVLGKKLPLWLVGFLY